MTTNVVAPSGRPFEPLDLSVLGAGNGQIWLSAHSRQGEVHGVPRSMPDFPNLVSQGTVSAWFGDAVGKAKRERDTALEIGRGLQATIFGVPEIASLFDQTRGVAAQRGANLLVRLLVAPSELAAWPWELIADPQQPDRFLVHARDVHLVRTARARTYPARQSPIAPPLHLLLVLSNPLRSGPSDTEAVFDLYAEKRALLRDLRPLVERGLLTIDVEERPSVQSLRSRMARKRHGYHLVHYLGHAQPDGLKLEDGLGRGRLVNSQSISALLQDLPDLRLTVFAGCETARAPITTVADKWPGQLSMTDYCVRDASPAVIGMQAVLPFATERLFTRYFYQSITAGRSIAEALRLARLAIADDENVGGRLLDWAVPCLFVGGSDPGPLIDPAAKVAPIPTNRRASLRLDTRQSDLHFFARQTELREAIDVLSGHNRCRLLQVVGGHGVGKSRLLDRVVEELNEDVARLFVGARRLLETDDPVQELCTLVDEVVRKAGCKTTSRGRRASLAWWERLLDDVADTRLAIVIDEADGLLDDNAKPLVDALSLLANRRGDVRIAVAATRENAALARDLAASSIRVIRLQPLAWPEVWQWIRRNLPVLTRYGDSALSPYFADLGSHLELWSDLADAVAQRATILSSDLPQLVRTVSQRLSALPATNNTAPPLFSSASPRAPVPDKATAATATPTSPVVQPLRVAIAGPFTSGRSAEFSRAMTALAAQLGVGGRVVLSDAADASSSLAQLLDLKTPFNQNGQATDVDLVKWVVEAHQRQANVILLDFGARRASRLWDDVLDQLKAAGTLLVAAGSNDSTPVYPAWNSRVLGVGALEADQKLLSPGSYDANHDKPELFAYKTTDGTPLEMAVNDRNLSGTSFAALHVVGAAVMVWATDRGLSAHDVREALLSTADRTTQGVRALNQQEALNKVRAQLLLDALEWGPLETGELLAETGLRSELALPLLDAMIASEALRKVVERGVERFEKPDAVYLEYDRLRRDTPSSDERTSAITRLLLRIQELARRNRFHLDDMRTMWQSGHPGRRVAALGAMKAQSQLRDFDLVLDGITSSRSAFEQFESLSVAELMLGTLSSIQRDALRNAITTQRTSSGWIKDGTDRAPLADRIIATLEPTQVN